ncbi:BlaI/MecI/CopY family transcriptional regulator [Verrucomicrobiaceae bacterium N1E253]|uniref:BlaI/MecI/CopY family transcriptional regulator n=1 Tax=Oceaniferula marina TaxID=2748318 RepID=A0A851GJE9_9BACT|nr:BlaI/MecI/CopY family transcriptional regulator [Oceaniferula marina]NWK54800.1 BlaI/MecI/CopY family transcriptional regulator [Oceaniferula marina]
MKKKHESPDLSPSVTHLAKAELAVMDLLWKQEPLTARQIREQLYPGQGASQNGTVQRLLQRLEGKGCVQRDRETAVNLFSTTLSREEYGGGQLESLANNLTAGSIAPLITHLVEKNRITAEEIDRIRAILEPDQHEKGKVV